MWSSGRRVLQELLGQPAVRSFSRTPAQNTVVVERWWQVPLSKVGSPPRLNPRRHRIYKLVEDTKHTPREKMELILTETVPKLGGRGDTVIVKRSVGRNKLLAQGLAVYPSQENKDMFAEELRLLREGKSDERIQTNTGRLTVELLKRCTLTISKAKSEEFQLNKDIVSRQILKRLGIVAPPHTLTLPFESIKELGDYWCEITVNGVDTVRIPMSLVPYEDPSAKHQNQLKLQRRQQQEQAAANMSEAMKQEEDFTVKVQEEDITVKAQAEDITVTAQAEDITVMAQEDITVKAKEEDITVKGQEEDITVKAQEEDITVKAQEDITVKAQEEDITVKAQEEDITVKAQEEDITVKATPQATGNMETDKVSDGGVAEAAASAEKKTTTETSQDTTAPPSGEQKKD